MRDAYVSTKSHPTEGQSGPGFARAPGTPLNTTPHTRIAKQCRRIKRVAPLVGATVVFGDYILLIIDDIIHSRLSGLPLDSAIFILTIDDIIHPRLSEATVSS